jgi:DUF3108-like
MSTEARRRWSAESPSLDQKGFDSAVDLGVGEIGAAAGRTWVTDGRPLLGFGAVSCLPGIAAGTEGRKPKEATAVDGTHVFISGAGVALFIVLAANGCGGEPVPTKRPSDVSANTGGGTGAGGTNGTGGVGGGTGGAGGLTGNAGVGPGGGTAGDAASGGGVAGGGGLGGSDAGEGGVGGASTPVSNRYCPLTVGAHWVWNETDVASGLSGTGQSTVEALDTLTGSKAGVKAFRVRSSTLTGGTLIWQEDTGTAVVRHQTQFLNASGSVKSYNEMVPSQLRLDETAVHMTPGATWAETYTQTKTLPTGGAPLAATVNVTWTVEAVDESVTVPAGTFACLRVHRVEAPSVVDTTGGDNRYWFARGVGKVKETGSVNHDLVSYSIP